MKSWALASVACILLANNKDMSVRAAEGSDPPGLRSPTCAQGLSRIQNSMLQHFNGIFGSFIVDNNDENDKKGSIYGPIAALNITTTGYGFNTNAKDINCDSPEEFSSLGFMSRFSRVDGDIHGSVMTNMGTVKTNSQTEACAKRSKFRALNRVDDFSNSLFSFAPYTIRLTSKKLSTFEPDTYIDRRGHAFTPASYSRTYPEYRVLQFPPCSDNDCTTAVPRMQTSSAVLKNEDDTESTYRYIPVNEMILFNIPVYVGQTYTLLTPSITKNVSPCQIIFNFYPVDYRGEYIDDPDATFTLARAPGVVIEGTILAPQANIEDSATGYFGGQLISLQNYHGKGADIKDFETVSHGQCTSRSLCLPAERKKTTVTEVITAIRTDTVVTTTKV